MTKQKGNRLGKALMRNRFQQQTVEGSYRHTTEMESTMNSITQENDLEAFLTTAQLAGTDFTAEKLNVQVMTNIQNQYLLSAEKEQETLAKHASFKNRLNVPRRPEWDETTTAEDLQRRERESFLEWRRELAQLEEEEGLLMTPYERNLEVWRQLWRVLERSDLIVQIVDARNPLLFRSEDLESYVQELDSRKKCLLIINKSDLLSKKQRLLWARHFKKLKIDFVFFSAAIANALLMEDHLVAEENTIVEEESQKSPIQILSALELIKVFYEKCPTSLSDKDKVTVGFVGYPNVGKSSTLNALLGTKKVTVSSTPGKTKHFQTMHLSEDLILCDCPGLVFPTFATTKADMVTNGILPIDQLREHTGPMQLVGQRIEKSVLEAIYGIKIPTLDGEGVEENRSPTAEEILRPYAVARGYKKAAQGNPDEARAARYILKDYVNGKLLFVHPPPSIDAKEFNEDSSRRMMKVLQFHKKRQPVTNVLTTETQVLSKVPQLIKQFNHVAVQAKTVGKFAQSTFDRVQLYPTQNQAKHNDDPTTKKHKKGKKNIKIRSGWTKDYDY